MQALSEAERETIVVRYLAEYHKSLNPEQINRIATDYKCGHPLFLKTVLEELRLVGRHEELNATIDRYLASTGTEDLFQRVLERLEEDYNMRAVREVMVLLSASRSGLDERELSELSGLARLKITTMTAGLDYHLVRKEGHLKFFHDYLRRAVEKRYLGDAARQRTAHLRIAEYFQDGVTALIAKEEKVPHRMANELAYQLDSAGEKDRLAGWLSTMPVFLALYDGQTRDEVLGYWSRIKELEEIEGRYLKGLQEWGEEDAVERSKGMGLVADLLGRLSRWPGAMAIQQERLTSAKACGDRSEEGASRTGLGELMRVRGDHAGAMVELTQAHELYKELGDRRGMSLVIGAMGNVYYAQGRYAEALECYGRQLAISEELGDRRGMARGIGNTGLVHANQGRHVEALECNGRALAIYEELGDRRGMALAIGSIGTLYWYQGRYTEAMGHHGRKLAICEELGDRHGMLQAIGNMGDVYSDQGRYAEAMECFGRSLAISEELGDHSGMALAIGSIGSLHSDQGRYAEAMECFGRAFAICEEIGDRNGMSVAIECMGAVHYDQDRYAEALRCYRDALDGHRTMGFSYGVICELEGRGRLLMKLAEHEQPMPEYLPEYIPEASEATWRAIVLQKGREDAEECIRISEELSKPDTIFSGNVLLARVEVAEGSIEEGCTRLRSMLAGGADDDQRAELHYWLWKLSATNEGDRIEALNLYQQLVEQRPKHQYYKRIDELTTTAPTEEGNATE